MSNIGFYRYKVNNFSKGDNSVSFYVNGNLVVTHSIITKENCTGTQLVKYIDKNGQYRFYPFNKYYEKIDNPEELGRTNEFITSIFDAQTDSKSVGYRNKRNISLVAESVTSDELDILADLWTSPRVYLYIGDGSSDNLEDWVECKIANADNLVRRRKGDFGRIAIELELPTNYTITML